MTCDICNRIAVFKFDNYSTETYNMPEYSCRLCYPEILSEIIKVHKLGPDDEIGVRRI